MTKQQSASRDLVKISSLFHETEWHLVEKTRGDGTEADLALDQLCQDYWKPIYLYVNSLAWMPGGEDAQDLTQGFLAQVASSGLFSKAKREEGRLRHFLLKCLKNYISKRHEMYSAKKRGGGIEFVSLDSDITKSPFSDKIMFPPDHVYDRAWAAEVVERALRRLIQERKKKGDHPALCESIPQLLEIVGDPPIEREVLASRVGLTTKDLNQRIFRLKGKFINLLFNEVASTMPGAVESDVRDEIRSLLVSLSF